MFDLNLLWKSNRVTNMLDRGTAVIDRSTGVTAVLVALVLIPMLWVNGNIEISTINMFGRYLCFALVAVSLNLLWGYTGMLCLCQSLFFAFGGYAMGMFLAHHGGPEGIVDVNNWKMPACLYQVYPGQVGESEKDWLVPIFWKPFYWFSSTVVLGLLLPGLFAAVIGFFVFRSRVKGVFFAILTQALTLAVWLVFTMNETMLCGTNGLTRFESVGPFTPENSGSQWTLTLVITGVLSAHFYMLAMWITNKFRNRKIDVEKLNRAKKLLLLGLSIGVALAPGMWCSNNVTSQFDLYDQLKDERVQLILYIASTVALIDVYLFCSYLIQSRIGRVLIAVRDNEQRLRFTGYKPYVFKVFVFTVSAMIAGLAGMLYAPQMGIFTPTNLETKESILVVIWVAVGGRGTLSGPIVGALSVNLLYNWLTSAAPDTWPFVQGALFILVVLVMPNGLVSIWSFLMRTKQRLGQPDMSPVDVTEHAIQVDDAASRLSRIATLQRHQTDSEEIQAEILNVENLSVVFDGFKALDIDKFTLQHYMLQVIIGPNGAGKTTFCDIISGKTRCTSGRLEYQQQDITKRDEASIARMGIGRKFQTPSLFDSLTVYENMEIALPNWHGLGRNLLQSTSSSEDRRILELLHRVGLNDQRDRQVKYLSHGQRQWLEISMLILSDPVLLLVDEPAAGLTDEETVLTAELLLELQSDHTIIVIEHDMDFVRLLNSPVLVLNEGKVMASGTMEEVQADERVVEAYLGR